MKTNLLPARLSLQWLWMLGLSLLFITALEYLHISAALLLGPMLAAIILALRETRIRVGRPFFVSAQGVTGCMVAQNISVSTLREVVQDWPVFLLGVFAVLFCSTLIGMVLNRWSNLPGTTALWGSSPGAASAMILMAEEYGADPRLVAIMQYTRVVCVTFLATGVAWVWMGALPPANGSQVADWVRPVAFVPFVVTAFIAVGGGLVAYRLRIPSGPLLLPLLLAGVLHTTNLVELELPPWFLACGYAVIGWSIGLRFTRSILHHALRALPGILVANVVLIMVCGGLSVLLVKYMGLDPLSAYLAMSPGGTDTVAIIAASNHQVNITFVTAMQTARLLIVIMLGPMIARMLARRMPARKP